MLCCVAVSRRRRLVLGIVLGASLSLHCSDREHPPSFVLPRAGNSAGGAGSEGGPDGFGGLSLGDAGLEPALCGKEQIPVTSDPPNLYFIVDRSFSMNDLLPGSGFTKYQSAYIAISVMLRAIGHRVRYGAAFYPDLLNQGGCAPGSEIFATTAGDPSSYAAKGENGPILSGLLDRLQHHAPSGATPTAASLRALAPTILGLPGKTFVILMTDGAPNCNPDLRCGVEACIPNIEHQLTSSGTLCDVNFNCCDPLVGGECVDASATETAVSEYEQAGVDTYVVGMPGSEAYGSILGRLALAGNTARNAGTPYYAVSDTNELSEALRSIGSQVAISCDLPLSRAPDDPELVNVYFDDQVVPSNSKNGWRFTGEKSIQFRGAACSELSSGDVLNVQVLSGCPTLVR